MLRSDLPALRAVYGLTWAEIEQMPYGELRAHLGQLPEWAAGMGVRLTGRGA